MWKHGRLGDTGSIPHHLAADWLSTRNPDFDDLCAVFTDVCTAIATYNAANLGWVKKDQLSRTKSARSMPPVAP